MKKFICIFFVIITTLLTSTVAFAHPGRTDANGGHWNRSTGTYHYHNGQYAGRKQIPSDSYDDDYPSVSYIKPQSTSTSEFETKIKKLEDLVNSYKNNYKKLSDKNNDLLFKMTKLHKEITKLQEENTSLLENKSIQDAKIDNLSREIYLLQKSLEKSNDNTKFIAIALGILILILIFTTVIFAKKAKCSKLAYKSVMNDYKLAVEKHKSVLSELNYVKYTYRKEKSDLTNKLNKQIPMTSQLHSDYNLDIIKQEDED